MRKVKDLKTGLWNYAYCERGSWLSVYYPGEGRIPSVPLVTVHPTAQEAHAHVLELKGRHKKNYGDTPIFLYATLGKDFE